MRNKFDEQLELLNHELIEMGALVESAIANAASAVMERNSMLAKKAVEFDAEVDRKEKDIESLCLKLLLHQQPVARDLRLISSALKMITDIERIGDQAADIAEISKTLPEQSGKEVPPHIPQMAKETIKMVNGSIDAYVKSDLTLAREVLTWDDAVDALFCKVKNDLIGIIQKDAEKGEYAMDFLMVAKYFERIGDHATNIAEWVEFSITGEHKSM